jgi:hypothetical protein
LFTKGIKEVCKNLKENKYDPNMKLEKVGIQEIKE